MTLDDLNTLIAAVGPLDDNILQVTRTSDDSWAIRYPAGAIELEYDEQLDRLMLSTSLGATPPDRRADVYEAMLLYSFVWRQTGGVRVGLAGKGGEIVQMADLCGAELSAATIMEVARNLATKAAILHAFISAKASDRIDLETDPFHMIRA